MHVAREYSKVGPRFWVGATGKAIRAAGKDAQIVAFYLMTSPHANMLGLYYLPIPYIAHETGLTIEGASEGLRRCIEAGFCAYDEAAECVWVFEMARYQIDERLDVKDKRCKGVQNWYDNLPENKYLGDFYDAYAKPFHMKKSRGCVSPFEAPSKPLRSQEQEQEQEQDIYRRSRASPIATETLPVDNSAKANGEDALPAVVDPLAHTTRPYLADAEDVLSYLNQSAQKAFLFRNPKGVVTASARLIIDRLKEGYSRVELRLVVAEKTGQWRGDAKMDSFLRPETLFSKRNFEQYLGDLRGGE